MPDPEITETSGDAGTETQSGVDTSAALAEISSDLFGQDGKKDGAKPAEGAEAKSSDATHVDAAASPPQPTEAKPAEAGEQTPKVEGGDNAAAVVETGAPKTWTKEALESWATIPPRAQQEILKREEDMLKGITQYKSAAEVGQKYDSVVEPYRAILTAENVDPVQMFQSFAANHYLLSRGTPAQKIELAANLIRGYDVDLTGLLNHIAEGPAFTPKDPHVTALERELAEIKGSLTQRATSEMEQSRVKIDAEVQAFAADKTAHPYFDELIDDISQLMGSGVSKSLQDAYDRAVYSNPATRQKEIDRLTAVNQSTVDAAAQARKDKINRSTADSVTTTPKSRNGTIPVGSLDDTLAETMAAISSRK